MTKNEIDLLKSGYRECRNVTIGHLKLILAAPDSNEALEDYLLELTEAEESDHWQTIQEEKPGITREEYEAQLEESAKLIREKYYSKDGYLKPRLLKPLKGE